ncbi:MAG TPA: LTA synthase family protein [Candidatus Polarisedimenticolaceae bacterium]|nr:LTA synthase family protein [Candidatus Polarisedimenticolaceae bacterium]
MGAALRVVLFLGFATPPKSVASLGLVLASGLVYDLLVGILLLAPLAATLAVFRLGWLSRGAVRGALLGTLVTVLAFSACVEWFYFDEFDARFNHIALDYIRHPGEVIGNIWESYNVVLVVAAAIATGALAGWAGVRFTRGTSFHPRPARERLGALGLVGAVTAACAVALALLPGEVSHDRILSEIGQNGIDRLVHAFRTGRLEYDLYYKSLPKALARRRAAGVLGFPPVSASEAESAAYHLIREGSTSSNPRPWDVVVIVEESFGSEFVGVLGHPERKTTPGFDRWSREGLLLTNLTSTGTRTVRGLEGTLCSLVPLPGEAVLKRKNPGAVATLASVFRRAGYDTAFVYGGWGRFDGMKPFFPDNGFDEFIERDAYPKDAFSTIWGVADEWILGQVLERQKRAAKEGRRLFLTALTVSNHRPFDVPERGTAWPARMRTRETGVAYADWALADYLDKAKAAGLLDHTLVLVEGDHGARVYGAEEIPAASYRIPGLFLVPDAAWHGKRLTRVCSQIDLAPTLLALLGRPVPAPFLGADVTRLPEDGGRAFLQHNRDVGLLTDRAMVVLGLERAVTCYARSGRDSDAWQRLSSCASRPDLQSLGDDAASVYETADDLVRRGVYTLPDAGGALASNPSQSSR